MRHDTILSESGKKIIQRNNLARYVFNKSLLLVFKWQNMFGDKIEWKEDDKTNSWRATLSL